MKIQLLFIATLILSLSITKNITAQISHTVNAGDYYYLPQSLPINVGDTVNWINDGGFHNVNFDISSITGNSFNNPVSFISFPTANPNIYSHVFTVQGTYSYDCSVGNHAVSGMVGNIIVNAQNTPLISSIDTVSPICYGDFTGNSIVNINQTSPATDVTAILNKKLILN